jgi:hypothetical protein
MKYIENMSVDSEIKWMRITMDASDPLFILWKSCRRTDMIFDLAKPLPIPGPIA